jgi:DNA invertase Pin-like site-specific DNA recombinase
MCTLWVVVTDGKTLAREYLRVSLDKSGRERSQDEQHNDNQRVADEHGWTLGEPYRDTGSASRFASNGRAGYDRLVTDLAAGNFGADLLVLWESSRGSRKVGEWVTLIELCEEGSVKIAVTTHGRVYDPSNARDRRSLIEDATDAEYETAKLSARARRAAAANAAAGKPHGPTPYGYVRRYDPVTRRLVAQDPEPTEAAVVRELFDRVTKGHSLKAITRDFEQRGIRARSGKVFHAATLRAMLQRPLYAGLRAHAPGRMTRQERQRKATVVDGSWPALVPRATYLTVQRLVSDPARKTARPGRGKHLLSMVALCDVCSGPLAVTYRSGRPEYQCHRRSCVRVNKAELDQFAETAILALLARPDNVERLVQVGDGEQLQQLRDEIAVIRAELDDLADQVGRGDLSATLAARAEPAILERLRATEAREAELSTPSALRGLISPGKDVARRWKAAPMSAKREVVRLLLTPDGLGELRVTRTPSPGRHSPIEDRVRWRT